MINRKLDGPSKRSLIMLTYIFAALILLNVLSKQIFQFKSWYYDVQIIDFIELNSILNHLLYFIVNIETDDTKVTQ